MTKKNASTSAMTSAASEETIPDHHHHHIVESHEEDENEDEQRNPNLNRTARRIFPKVHSSNFNTQFSQLPQSEDTIIPSPQPTVSHPHIIHLDTVTPTIPIQQASESPHQHEPASSHVIVPEQGPVDDDAADPNNTQLDPYFDPTIPDASDDDIILSLISNTLFLWGALFVLIVSLWDLTDLKLQSDLPLILYDDNTQPSHLRANVHLYNAASLLGPIFYFLNAIFDYLWALFIKEKTSLYAKYLGRMDPLWDILYGVFFGLGAVMDIIHASISISIGRSDGNEDDFEVFFTLFSICSTFFYLVSGLFFLFAVEFTTCRHPVKMIILLGDCLFLAGSAMDFFLSLISDPDIIIEDQIHIAHGHILSNTFWTINAALYLIADIVVWWSQKKPSLGPVDELVSIVMKDLTLDRRLSTRSRLSSSHRRMSTTWMGEAGGSGSFQGDLPTRSRRATMEDGLPTRSRLTTWDVFMNRPIVTPESTQNLTEENEKNPNQPSNSSSWDLFLSRPRFRRATVGTVEDVHELELTETLDALKGTMT